MKYRVNGNILHNNYNFSLIITMFFTGALAMPRWASVSSLNSSSSSRSGRDAAGSALEPSLLTTCVGSMSELIDLISKVAQVGRSTIPLTTKALNALFYYMRCSQVFAQLSPKPLLPFLSCLCRLADVI